MLTGDNHRRGKDDSDVSRRGRSTLNRGERNARSKRDYGTDGKDGTNGIFSWFSVYSVFSVCSVISFRLPYNSPRLNVGLSTANWARNFSTTSMSWSYALPSIRRGFGHGLSLFNRL